MSQVETLIPVAIYARISGPHEEDANAVEPQLDRIRTYAEQNAMRPVSHFVDKFGSREEFDLKMAQATGDTPPFQKILVYNL